MKHETKKTLARRLQTQQERRDRVPVFQSEAWESRKQAISQRIANLARDSLTRSSKVDGRSSRGRVTVFS